ncbi:hypothetical protein FRX31_010518 [Thalictrum thalictroides]|uniref:Protein E6 n=1 Tax=Thalictrum thalictroides TaxID=46969 RepID=A0A7J6WR88_THATH|nr:hypothetical protein FRX31_010518 [Thalictrum thalictroides]
MAFPVKYLAFFFLIFLCSSIQIHARESKFFSKFNHYQTATIGSNNIPNTNTGSSNATSTVNPTTTINDNSGSNESELSQESLVKQEEEPSFTQQTSNGYGLYGHGSTQDSSTTDEINQDDAFGDLPEKTSTQEYTRGRYEDKEANTGYRGDNNGNYGYKTKQFGTSTTRLMDNGNVNSYNGYEKQYDNGNINNNNNNGYEAMQGSLSDTTLSAQGNNDYKTRDFSMSNSRFMDNGINKNNGYETKQYGTSGIGKDDNLYRGKQQGVGDTKFMENGRYYFEGDDNLSKGKQQGLSDTRFMENGKYFYNVNNENSYLNEYHPVVNRNFDGFRSSSQGVSSRNNYNYGNNNEKNEFNNSMEENQEEFQP